MLSSDDAFTPANLFEKTPGAPLSISTSNPVSSEKTLTLNFTCIKFALKIAFSFIVFSFSGC